MPEIKFKHVVSFSSEDKVFKAENLIKPEGYQKWKCSTPGEKNATVILQFEKASQIHSIDIGNEGSAFIEVLVGRSSDTVKDFQVLLVASSFMSPAESRNGTHTNRVRMFGPEKLSQNAKDQKWDCVQIVCTQPFNKNMTYGLSFIKFHTPSEKNNEATNSSDAGKVPTKLGSFSLKSDEDEDSLPKIGSWFERKKDQLSVKEGSFQSSDTSYAASVLAASAAKRDSPKDTHPKRKSDYSGLSTDEPPVKKNSSKQISDFISYKPLDVTVEKTKDITSSPVSAKNSIFNKATTSKNYPDTSSKSPVSNKAKTKPSESSKQSPASIKVKNKRSESSNKSPGLDEAKSKNSSDSVLRGSKKTTKSFDKPVPFSKIMKKVVFVLSGFVNPLRSEIRDKALEMGAKYKGDWDKSCTHLVCAFLNTPKYIQVRAVDGRVVSKEWILDCHRTKSLLPWRDYMLGKYDFDSTDNDDFSEPEVVQSSAAKENSTPKTNMKAFDKPKINGAKSKPKSHPSTSREDVIQIDSSDTEDEDALRDYMADTDKDSGSGGDTEDEILKIEKDLAKNQKSAEKRSLKKFPSVEELSERPDIEILPMPELPNFFKKKHFFLFGEFSGSNYHKVTRYITAYNGLIEDYMSEAVKYVITEESWDKNFDDALAANEDLIFIKPSWIFKCHEEGKFLPYHPFIITPTMS